jgi:hypothetical protein
MKKRVLLTRKIPPFCLPSFACPHFMPRSSEDVSHPLDAIHWKDNGKGDGLERKENGTVSPEEDEKTQLLSQGLTLLLAARGRVLTLSEQRVSPSITHLIATHSFV